MKLRVILLGILFAAGSVLLHAQDSVFFNYKGYIRSGFGLDGQGKSMDAFKAPNSDAKYRLGNEAETYAEAVFHTGMMDENKALFETQLTLALVAPTSKSNSFATTLSLREAFVNATGVIQKQAGISFWAGQRFYERLEVHIKDYWPRDMSGFGGGVEGIPLGSFAKGSLAYIGGSIDELEPDGTVRPENQFALNKSTFDFRIYDISVKGGKLEVIMDLSNFSGDKIIIDGEEYEVLDNLGWSLSLLHQQAFARGLNLVHLFYGSGSAENGWAIITSPVGLMHTPGVVVDPSGFKRFRVVEDLRLDFGGHVSLQGTAIYQYVDNNMLAHNVVQWITAGIRPVWFFNRYFSLAGEFGWDYTLQEGLNEGHLFKATLAPQISPLNRIMSRPVLRAFLTYATWSDSFVGQVAPVSFPDQSRGISFGLQMEVWW